jgi:hypothetical protein
MSKLVDAVVLAFEDAVRDQVKTYEEKHRQETASLRNRISELIVESDQLRAKLASAKDDTLRGVYASNDVLRDENRILRSACNDQRAEAVANAKTATDFMQQNEALRAENAKLRAEAESANRYFAVGVKLTGEKQALQEKVDKLTEEVTRLRASSARHGNDERTIENLRERVAFLEQQCAAANQARYAVQQENNKLRAENNAQDAQADDVIENLRVQLRLLQEEYANRGQIIQDFAKREHTHQEKIAALEKVLKEFFPAPIIPAPRDEKPTMSIPQGEWVLRSNEALRNRVVEIERQCELTEVTALQWLANYERQMAVNARQRSRIAELRLRLNHIRDAEASCQWMAAEALGNDDRIAE